MTRLLILPLPKNWVGHLTTMFARRLIKPIFKSLDAHGFQGGY